MVSRPPDWQDIYEKSLECKAYGVPLWNPQPSSPANLVNIGDVGYVYKGEFYRIFNATKKDDKYCGNAKPLVINPTTDVVTKEWPQRPVVPEGIKWLEDASPNVYTFKTTKIRGALFIPSSIPTEEYLAPSKEAEWKRYMARNLDDWPEPEVCNRRDLRLVYGRVMAARWLLVTFEMRGPQAKEWIFKVTVPTDGGSKPEFQATQGEFSYPPDFRRGADVVSLLDSGSGASAKLPSHCVFLRGYQPTKSRGVLGWKVEDTLPRATDRPSTRQWTLKGVAEAVRSGVRFRNKGGKDTKEGETGDKPSPVDPPV